MKQKSQLLMALVFAATIRGAEIPSQLRVIDGQIYNVERSVSWRDLTVEVIAVKTNGIHCREFSWERRYKSRVGGGSPGPGGNFLGANPQLGPSMVLVSEKKVYGRTLLLVNYSGTFDPGDEINGRFFPRDRTDVGGQMILVFDWGQPPTQEQLDELRKKHAALAGKQKPKP